MKRLLGTLVALSLLLTFATPAQSATVAPPDTPRAGVVFNNPKGTKAQQLAIITQIDRALDAAPKGATIYMAQYLFDIDSTADKMIAAYQRGVHVQVLIDDGERTPQIARVREALGKDKSKLSFVATCRHGCMADTASVMHAKFYLFSQAGTARLVSMVSSANPYTGNTFKSWNDIDTIIGDARIYASLVQYFKDMLKDRTDLNYFRTTTSGLDKLYLYPRAPQVGVTTVALLDVLNHVACTGAAPGYGSGGRTVIRVAMWGWTGARIDIAKRLWTLHDAGCRVTVIYNSGRTSRSVTAALLKRSSRYGVMSVSDAWLHNQNGFAGFYMHLKMLTVNGVWFGHRDAKVTYTGSQNFTGPATVVNNDVILRMIGAATHDAYARNFDFIQAHYTERVTQVPPRTTAATESRISRPTSDGV